MAIRCVRITGSLFRGNAGPANDLATIVDTGGQAVSPSKSPEVDHALAFLPQKRVGRRNAQAGNGVRTRILGRDESALGLCPCHSTKPQKSPGVHFPSSS
jgi:hypothetical protein